MRTQDCRGDIRAANKIEFDTKGVPKNLQDILESKDKGGQYSRAERHMIEQRKDLLEKTALLK